MSEQILLLNPRPRKKRRSNRRRARARRTNRRGRMPAALKRYWASHRRTNRRRRPRRTNSRRRSHARRINRRTHYATARRHNRRPHHYRRRRNRASVRQFVGRAVGSSKGIVKGYLVPVTIGGAGGVVLDIAWGYASPRLPLQLQGGWGGLFAKLGVVLGIAYGMNRFLPRFRQETERAAFGAGSVLAYSAIRGLVKQAVPSLPLSGYVDYQSYSLPVGMRGLSGYMPRTLGGLEDMYSPAAVIQPPGTPVPSQFGRLAGYIAVQPHVSGSGGLMGYDWAHDGM